MLFLYGDETMIRARRQKLGLTELYYVIPLLATVWVLACHAISPGFGSLATLFDMQATCCSDKLHCCPNGYTCDVQAGKCNKGAETLPWEMKRPSKPEG
jgi:hypothetical protein